MILMRSLPEAKALLARLYGLEFPDSLFLLQEFLAGLPEDERPDRFGGLGMEPIGPLQVLSCSDAELERIKLRNIILTPAHGTRVSIERIEPSPEAARHAAAVAATS